MSGKRLPLTLIAVSGLLLGLYLTLRCQDPESHRPKGDFLRAEHIQQQLERELELSENQKRFLAEKLQEHSAVLERLQLDYKQIHQHFAAFEASVGEYLSAEQMRHLREIGDRHRAQEKQARNAAIERCLAGAAISAAVTGPTAPDLAAQMAEIQPALGLDEATAAKLATALQRLSLDVERVRQSIKPRYRQLRTQIHGALSGELNNQQRSKLTELDRRRACKP